MLWNLWHVYMQKFGILRVYMAKDPAPREQKTPAWVDKLFVLCWFPLYFAWVGPARKELMEVIKHKNTNVLGSAGRY